MVIDEAGNTEYLNASDLDNLGIRSDFEVTDQDITNPTLVSSSPSDDETSAAVDSDIVLNFSEPVNVG